MFLFKSLQQKINTKFTKYKALINGDFILVAL